MKRFIAALALVTVASATVGIAGCGGDDDDDDSSGTAGTASTAGKGSTGGEPGSNGGEAAGGTPSTGNVACDPAEATTCQNEGDCPAVQSGEARMAAGVCGSGECLGAADSGCAITCIQRTVDVSDECADCYGAAVACTAKKCLDKCLGNTEGDACKACQVEMGCREAFNTCSGLPE